MALINDMYILVTSESVSDDFEKTNYPVESGAPLSDHVERQPVKVSIEGYAINTDTQTANYVHGTLRDLARKGERVRFIGRNTFSTGVITSFEKKDDNTVANGTALSMTIEELRIAQSAYRPPNSKANTNAGTKQTTNTGTKTTASTAVYHTVKEGECLSVIAKKYGITLQTLLKNNTVPSGNPDKIYPGEKYLISK